MSTARAPSLERLGTYRIDRSYEWNYAHGPQWQRALPQVPATPRKTFFGIDVSSRIGISAGLLLNAQWLGFYARCGFDILTYKTVRSRRRECHPMPNWLFIDPGDIAHVAHAGRALHAHKRPAGGDPRQWTSTVSYGMPSRDPAVWMADVARARAALSPGQALVVSVVASPDGTWSRDDIVRDFGALAAMAREAGAQAVEANLSCPNVRSAEGDLYLDAAMSGRIAAALRAGADALPVLLKIGHVPDDERLRALLHAVAGQAHGLVVVNGVSRPVLGPDGAAAFGDGRRQAGILGRGIHAIGVADVARALKLIRRERLDLQVAGVGGVASADDAAAYFDAGACAVLLGSAPMYDPALAARLKTQHPEW
ncbi:MAG TPA: hypothetical protein VFK10_17935 [Burkholderiaceae bacterium]|nr:hypothetical protein [Burkholderiaceae bacterium]